MGPSCPSSILGKVGDCSGDWPSAFPRFLRACT